MKTHTDNYKNQQDKNKKQSQKEGEMPPKPPKINLKQEKSPKSHTISNQNSPNGYNIQPEWLTKMKNLFSKNDVDDIDENNNQQIPYKNETNKFPSMKSTSNQNKSKLKNRKQQKQSSYNSNSNNEKFVNLEEKMGKVNNNVKKYFSNKKLGYNIQKANSIVYEGPSPFGKGSHQKDNENNNNENSKINSNNNMNQNKKKKEQNHLQIFEKQNEEDDDDQQSEDSEISFLKENINQEKELQKQKLKRLVEIFKEETLDPGEKGETFGELNRNIYQHLPIFQEIQNELIEEELSVEFGLDYEEELLQIEPPFYLDVIEMNQFEKIGTFKPKNQLDKFLKLMWTIKEIISYVCLTIIKSNYFEFVTLLVIIANSVFLAYNDDNETDATETVIENTFLYLYTIEMILKIVGLGFIFPRGSYLRDPWNILDFVIVATAYPSLFTNQSKTDLSALRSLRVLRPLRTISNIKALRAILVALFSAFKLLINSIIMLMFFFMIFAIAGLQLFQGVLYKRCYYEETGIIADTNDGTEPYCNDDGDCNQWEEGDLGQLICGKMGANPDWGQTNFDSFPQSLMQVFIIVTLEGWSDIMYSVMKTYQSWVVIFFIVIVFVGAFFLMNLTLAIIKVKYKDAQTEPIQDSTQKDMVRGYGLKKLIQGNIYESKKLNIHIEDIKWVGNQNQEEDFQTDRNLKDKISKLTKLKGTTLDSEREGDDRQQGLIRDFNKNTTIIIENTTPQGNSYINKEINARKLQKQRSSKIKDQKSGVQEDEKQNRNMEVLDMIKRARRKSTTRQTVVQRLIEPKKSIYEASSTILLQRRNKKFQRPGVSRFQGIGVSSQKKHTQVLTDIQKQKLRSMIQKHKQVHYRHSNLENKKVLKPSFVQANDRKMLMAGPVVNFQRQIKQKKQENLIKENSQAILQSGNIGYLTKRSSQLSSSRMQQSYKDNNSSDYNNMIKSSQNNLQSDEEENEEEIDIEQFKGQNNQEIPQHKYEDQFKVNIMGLRKKQIQTQKKQKQKQKQQRENSIKVRENKYMKQNQLTPQNQNQQASKSLQLSKNVNTQQSDNKEKSEIKIYIDNVKMEQSKNVRKNQNKSSSQSFSKQQQKILNNQLANSNYKSQHSKTYLMGKSNASFQGIKQQSQFQSKQTDQANQINNLSITLSLPSTYRSVSSDNDDNEDHSFDIHNPRNRLILQDDEDFTAEQQFNHKFHQDIEAIREDKYIIEKKKRIMAAEQKRRKTILMEKKKPASQKQHQNLRKINFIEDEDEEIARLRIILKPKYLKTRISYTFDKQQDEQINDVMPSKILNQKKLLEEEQNEIKKQLKFKIKYEFEQPRIREIAIKRKNQGSKLFFAQSGQQTISYINKSASPSSQQWYRQNRKSHGQSSLQNSSNPGSPVQNTDNNNFVYDSQGNQIYQQKSIVQNTHNQYSFYSFNSKRDAAKKMGRLEANMMSKIDKFFIQNKYFLNEDNNYLQTQQTQENQNDTNGNSQQKKQNSIYSNQKSVQSDDQSDTQENNKEKKDKNKDKNQDKDNQDDIDELALYNKEEDELIKMYDKIVNEMFTQRQLNENGLQNLDVKWSGEDVNGVPPNFLAKNYSLVQRMDNIIKSLNYSIFDYEMWEGGLFGIIQSIRRIVLKIVLNKCYDYLIMICVLLNTLILAMNGLVSVKGQATLDNYNYIFTIVFTVDMGLKLIGMGVMDYVRDQMNIFDGVIVILSWVEFSLLNGSNSTFSAFRSVRILRTFRVLRVTKLIRSLRYMQIIVEVIGNTLSSFFYIFLLMFLFNYIYALLGMQQFDDKFDFDDNPTRMSFNTFLDSFMAVFQVMSMENWNDILHACLRTDNPQYLTLVFLISWIFIGNYVLLNLFLSILLDAFDDQAQKNQDDLKFEIAQDLAFSSAESLTSSYFLSGSSKLKSQMQSQLQSQSANNKHLNQVAPQSFQNSPSQLNAQSKFIMPLMINNQQIMSPQLKQSQNSNFGSNNNNLGQNNLLVKAAQNDIQDEEGMLQSQDNGQKTVLSSLANQEDDEGTLEKSNQQKNNKLKKQLVMFENIKCERAFYFISKQNCIRRFCYRIVKHEYFESVILGAIVLSSVKLAVDTYTDTLDNTQITNLGTNLDLVFNIFFLLESIFKAISFGFVIDENSYLRESWSQLDFLIVLINIVDTIFQYSSFKSLNLGFVKILRLLRILRPLRFISHNKNMKIVVTALMESAPAVINVLIVVLLIWLMFAILGISFMQGRLYRCVFPETMEVDDDYIYQVDMDACNDIEGASWERYNLNFDNIFTGMLTLFVLATQEGWPDYMWQFVDGSDTVTDYDSPYYGKNIQPPIKDNLPLFQIYFIVFLFIGSWFLLNLFIGVVQLNFILAESAAKNKFLSDDQAKWIEIQRLIVKSRLDFASVKPPNNKYRQMIWNFCQSWVLDTIVMTCIILNIITMAMSYEGMSTGYEKVLSNINLAFTSVFILECILKLTAYGLRGYFYNKWNQFDFFVVCTSIIDLIMFNFLESSIEVLAVGPQLGRVFRVLRVTRLFRLIKAFQDLKQLIQVTILTLPQLMNISALLFLVFFIFSILGNTLFSEITNGEIINEYMNFSNFHKAFILLLQCSTGEDWFSAMFTTMNEVSQWSWIYFVVFVILIQFIMINLFILVILVQFEENFITVGEDNPLMAFQDNESSFKSLWIKYTRSERGIKMHQNKLTDFFLDLEEPLGLDWKNKKISYIENIKIHHKDLTNSDLEQLIASERVRLYKQASQLLMHMQINTDHEGYIYYNDLLFFFYKDFLKEKTEAIVPKSQFENEAETINNYNEALKLIELEEKKSERAMTKLKRKQNKNYKQRGHNLPQANPMERILFVNMCYRAWLHYSQAYYEKMLKEKNQGNNFIPEVLTSTENSSDDESDDDFSDDDDNKVIDENDEYESQRSIKKKKKKTKKNIKKREHGVAKAININIRKFKDINKINTDIYQQEIDYEYDVDQDSLNPSNNLIEGMSRRGSHMSRQSNLFFNKDSTQKQKLSKQQSINSQQKTPMNNNSNKRNSNFSSQLDRNFLNIQSSQFRNNTLNYGGNSNKSNKNITGSHKNIPYNSPQYSGQDTANSNYYSSNNKLLLRGEDKNSSEQQSDGELKGQEKYQNQSNSHALYNPEIHNDYNQKENNNNTYNIQNNIIINNNYYINTDSNKNNTPDKNSFTNSQRLQQVQSNIPQQNQQQQLWLNNKNIYTLSQEDLRQNPRQKTHQPNQINNQNVNEQQQNQKKNNTVLLVQEKIGTPRIMVSEQSNSSGENETQEKQSLNNQNNQNEQVSSQIQKQNESQILKQNNKKNNAFKSQDMDSSGQDQQNQLQQQKEVEDILKLAKKKESEKD